MSAVDMITQAQAYVDRGWSVVLLHHIEGDRCSCGSADPVHVYKQGGKHPVMKEWQRHGIKTREQIVSAWTHRPNANIGIATGAVSGFWALDVDPENGGHTALAGLVAAYGVLPETYTVTTGSGGMHYYWQIPDWEPHAGDAKRLPAGLDLRGWGGQVVAPPSVSGKGIYRIGADVALAPAPDWLLDIIRPPAATVAEPRAAEGEWSASAPVPGFVDRGRAYAAAAVSGALNELAGAPPGTRNETAYRVACRLLELIASPWAGLDSRIYADYLGACAMTNSDGTFTEAEAGAVWLSAMRHVAGRGVALPDADFYGTAIPLPDFSPPGIPGIPILVDPTETADAPVVPTNDPRETAILAEMSRQWVRDEAGRRLRDLRAGAWSMEFLDRDAQRKIAQPVPLVAGWIARGHAVRVFGPPGAGKSFVAVELAACVSTGMAWHGRRVAAGEVVYLAAEDAPGVVLRLEAWERHHEIEHRVYVVDAAIRLDAETVGRMLGALRERFVAGSLALIVVDTQAMVTVGLDENDAGDMGLFVEAVKLLGRETGASVLVVHHSGVKGGRARGSTSVLGAMDTELESAIIGRTVTLTSTKQKNIAKPPPIMMNLHTVDMGRLDEFGQPVTSCVLVAAGDPGTPIELIDPAPGLSSRERHALAIATVLIETNASGETYARVAARACLVTDFGKTPSGVKSAFSRAWAFLVERGRISKAVGREAFYFIEVDGLDRLAMNPDKRVVGGPEAYQPPQDET